MEIEVRKRLINKYRLEDLQKIEKYALEEISHQEKIEFKDLIFMLGGNRKILYKEQYSWTRINLKKTYYIREFIQMIKMDLKYLPQYGERLYTKEEIEKICTTYKVSIEDFLTYISRKRICYYGNFEIIQNNKKGLWIGKNPALSNKFLKENIVLLMEETKKQANIIVKRYCCNWMKENLINVGFYCIQQHGEIERNFSFNKDITIEKLIYKAKFKMLDEMIQYFKSIKYSYVIENMSNKIEEENNKIEEWLGTVQFSLMQKIIIDKICDNLEQILINKRETIYQICKNLNITINVFRKNIREIQMLLITSNKAKICKNGRVIIVNEES